MKYELTVLCPGIRTKNWKRLFDSIPEAFKGSWEIIFIGPYDLPVELKGIDNVKYIEDWGSPIRCQQLGLSFVEGVFVTWAADDGYFLKDSLTIAYDKIMKDSYIASHGEKLINFLGLTNTGIAFNHKKVVMGKYQEGPRVNDGMEKDWYYILSNHDSMKMGGVPVGSYMLNVGLVPTVLLKIIGGWDASTFEVCPMAYNDLAIRLQKHGVKFIIQDEMMFSCSHMPGHEGDHGPIHDAQIYHDEPIFSDIYRIPNDRVYINIDNWVIAPEKWTRRFGK
jgi:hypothetical protein